MTAMTLEEIDDALADWHTKLTVSAQNLIAIDDLFTFRRLNGEAGISKPTLTGESALRVPDAVASVARLWEYQQLLSAMVDRANGLRKTMPTMFGAEKVRQQITDILQGTSIDFPPIEVPLSERGLLTVSRESAALSPQQLLETMSRTYDAAKSVIMEVDAAWNQKERELASLNEEVEHLLGAAREIGEPDLPDLATINRRIGSLNDQMSTDPLGAGANSRGELLPLLRRVRDQVEQTSRLRLQTITDLDCAHRLIDDLESLALRTERASQLLTQRVELQASPILTLDKAVIAELNSWLNTLQASFDTGMWRPVQVGITRWLASAGAAFNTVKSALDTANALLEASNEFKGRLMVQRSRAEGAMRNGLVIPEDVCRLGDAAERLLKQVPVPLDRVKRLVEEYEQRLGEIVSPGIKKQNSAGQG